MAIVAALTKDELEAGEKGYWKQFHDYVDLEEAIRIPAYEYARLVAWCGPYMARRHEVQGAVTFRFSTECAVIIERAYVMGGNSQSFRTTCLLDPEDMIRQMQVDYPDRTQFMSHEVGWWHLHPGYFPGLSVGDVEECRETLRACNATDTKILHLLMYGDPRGGYVLTGYLIGIDEVNRLPVRIAEPF